MSGKKIYILAMRLLPACILPLVLLGPPASRAVEPAAGAAKNRPVAPRIHPATGAKLYSLHPGLEVDAAAGELYVESKVCLDSGILEFLLVQGETKAYESALSTDASPSQLMAGMLLLKWKPGDLLSILLLRGKDTLALDELLQARDPKAPKSNRKGFRWRLAGSNHGEMQASETEVQASGTGFWADREGIHVTLVERAEAVVQLEGDTKNPYHNARFGYTLRRGAVAKMGQPLTLIFRKAKSGAG